MPIMNSLMPSCIAERKLLYSVLRSNERKPVSIRIYAPFRVEQNTVNFRISDGTAACTYELHGLPEQITDTVYGVDSIQALQLASDIDGLLQSLGKKYQFYFPTGEPYFE
jgi:hypothetical protein